MHSILEGGDTLPVMESFDGSPESLREMLDTLRKASNERRETLGTYDLPMKLSHGSLGVIEQVFGEQLVLKGGGLTPEVVSAAPQAKLDEVDEFLGWASFLGRDEARWVNTFRGEVPGRLLVPAARTLNAGVSMAMYAEAVLLPDPLNPQNMHTVMKYASVVPKFRRVVEYHVGILALLAPLVRAGKIVLAPADHAHFLALQGYLYGRNAIRELRDELFVEQQQLTRASFRALDAVERMHPIRSKLFGASISYDGTHVNDLANRLFALTMADTLHAGLFDLIRDGKQFALPRNASDFTMRRLTGISLLMMPGLERMPFSEVLAIAQGSEVAAELRSVMGPIFDALPPGLSDMDSVQYLRMVAEERLQPSLRRLEREVSAVPGAESWMGAAVGLSIPIVELTTTNNLGPASYAALAGAPLPMLAGWVAGRSDRQLASRTRRALATALPATELKRKRPHLWPR